jgi:hypothetical protein
MLLKVMKNSSERILAKTKEKGKRHHFNMVLKMGVKQSLKSFKNIT